jgi:glycosyltransferase involved in cell wall biosynthesis
MKTPTSTQVAHVTTAHPPSDNRIMHKECTALAEAGIDVCLVAVADRDQVIDGVHIRALRGRSNRLGRMVLGPVDAWRALRVLRPSLIHVHDPELIPLALVWRLGHGRTAIYDAHEDLPKQVMGKTYIPEPLRKVVARFAHGLELTADKHLDSIVAATPRIARNFTHAPVVLVQNFPWLRDFPEPVAPKPGVKPKIVYVGGITAERGCVEMIRGVQESNNRPELVLAGQATDEMRKLMAAESDNGITYLGIVPADQVPGIVADSCAGLVLLHPLLNYLESQPTKLFEYMAAGLPFVASDFESWRNLLSDLDCGFFIDPLDVQAIADTLDRIVKDPQSAREMGGRGREALKKSFTFEIEAERLITVTQKLLSA